MINKTRKRSNNQPNAKASKFQTTEQPPKTIKNSKHRKTGNWIWLVAATLTNKKHPNQNTMSEPNRTEQNETKLNREASNKEKREQKQNEQKFHTFTCQRIYDDEH